MVYLTFDFQNLHFLTKYFLIFFMIIGRIELLSLLLIAKNFFLKINLVLYISINFAPLAQLDRASVF